MSRSRYIRTTYPVAMPHHPLLRLLRAIRYRCSKGTISVEAPAFSGPAASPHPDFNRHIRVKNEIIPWLVAFRRKNPPHV